MRYPAVMWLVSISVLGLVGCQPAPSQAPTTAPAAAPTKPAAPAASPATSPAASPAAAASPSPSPRPAVSPVASPSPGIAASPSAVAGGRVITFDAFDYGYTLPDTLPAGRVTLLMRNTGKAPHHAQLVRLNTGVTIEQFTAALRQSEAQALALVSFKSGNGVLDPGLANANDEVTVDLAEGSYAVVCFLMDPDGVPHFAKGMVKPLQVTAAQPGAAAAEPSARVTVTLKDFSFESPDTLPAGRNTWRITNAGPQPHEIQVARLAAGKTSNDVLSFFTNPAGPPPFQSPGGFQAIDANAGGWLTLDLPAGDYAFYCAVPDPATGKRHLEEGMLKQVKIASQ